MRKATPLKRGARTRSRSATVRYLAERELTASSLGVPTLKHRPSLRTKASPLRSRYVLSIPCLSSSFTPLETSSMKRPVFLLHGSIVCTSLARPGPYELVWSLAVLSGALDSLCRDVDNSVKSPHLLFFRSVCGCDGRRNRPLCQNTFALNRVVLLSLSNLRSGAGGAQAFSHFPDLRKGDALRGSLFRNGSRAPDTTDMALSSVQS